MGLQHNFNEPGIPTLTNSECPDGRIHSQHSLTMKEEKEPARAGGGLLGEVIRVSDVLREVRALTAQPPGLTPLVPSPLN